MRESLKHEFDGFAKTFIDMFDASNGHFATRPIYALPVGHCWPNRRGLTLLGDAAHVMSPFGGDGVNNAMFDAAELARLLVERQE
jgi:2-polyprenyl-6-methoxyphenol hydroxylase-like FAD-dependent oxidoreductase